MNNELILVGAQMLPTLQNFDPWLDFTSAESLNKEEDELQQ